MTDLFSKFDPLIETREQLLSTGLTDPFNLVMERVVSPTVAICNGRETILLGTYNYMGMTFDPDVIAAGHAALDAFGSGTNGSRMLNGTFRDHMEAEEALRPLRAFGPPALDAVQPMPYVALQQLIDADYPPGRRHYWTGDFLTGLPDEAIEILCRFHLSKPSPGTEILLLPDSGASARVAAGAMAIDPLVAPFNVHITSQWEDPADDEPNIAWTRELSAALKPFTTGRVYVNFIGDEGPARVRDAYPGATYDRLAAIKRQYDPDNMFRRNQNVEPAGA